MRSRCRLAALGAALVGSALFAAPAQAADVFGPQSGTWALADSPFFLVGDVTVPVGAALVIEPGVEVIANGHFELRVEGLLTAVGTPEALIHLTAADTGAGWRGLRLVAANDATRLSYCLIEYGKGSGDYPEVRGGNLRILDCSPTVSHCTIRFGYSHNGNSNGTGGAISVENSSALIEHNLLTDNQADSGGGVMASIGSPTIRGNLITDNTGWYAGGGLYLGAGTSPLIEDNLILRNHAGGWGGGGINSWTSYIYYGTYATIRNNLIAHNTANDGAGLYCRYDKAVLVNNTIVFNSATGQGGGIYALNYPAQAPEVRNTILWGNNAAGSDEIFLYGGTGSAISVRYCDVSGGYTGIGNIDSDPNFVNADGPDGTPGTDDDDLSIAAGSACIDAGMNAALGPDVELDLAGRLRYVDDPDTDDTGEGEPPLVDLGAYEYQACPGDLNGDGQRDQADLGLLLASYGQDDGGDIDGDGDTDQADLGALLGVYGEPCLPS